MKYISFFFFFLITERLYLFRSHDAPSTVSRFLYDRNIVRQQ
jgi:hypothetical protein